MEKKNVLRAKEVNVLTVQSQEDGGLWALGHVTEEEEMGEGRKHRY